MLDVIKAPDSCKSQQQLIYHENEWQRYRIKFIHLHGNKTLRNYNSTAKEI